MICIDAAELLDEGVLSTWIRGRVAASIAIRFARPFIFGLEGMVETEGMTELMGEGRGVVFAAQNHFSVSQKGDAI